MTDAIQTKLEDGLFSITFNRPEKKNALTVAMYEGLIDAYQRAAKDPDTRVLLVSGAGGAFTAGNDLMDFMQDPPKDDQSPVARFLEALVTFEKPVVAAVEGHAIGLGTTMLLHADLVYASSAAKFKLPFVRLGLVPEGGSSFLLPRLAGWRRAAELLFFGDTFDAQTAVDAGLVNRVVEPGTALAVATERATALTKLPIGALVETKRLMLTAQREGVASAMEREGALFMERLTSPEAMEAFSAFFERREPKFN